MADTDTTQTPPETEPAPQAVEAAEQVAQQGGTQAQATQAAATEQQAQRPELSPKETKAIAAGIVDELDERGMFEHAEPEAVTLPPSEPVSSPASGAETGTGGSAGPTPDEPPRKESWAARFLKDKGNS